MHITPGSGTENIFSSLPICPVDWLTYRSYWAQRKMYGCSAEQCARGYQEHRIFEQIYLMEQENEKM